MNDLLLQALKLIDDMFNASSPKMFLEAQQDLKDFSTDAHNKIKGGK